MASSSSMKCVMVVVLLSSMFAITSGDAKVKGCPFDSIYSLGVKDSSPGAASHQGSTTIDQLANAFHLPSPKVYTQKYDRFPYGVNFATENAVALTRYFLGKRGIEVPPDSSTDSITSQLYSFVNYLDPICSYRFACREKFQRAFFVVDFGSNDYKHSFLNGKSIQEVEEYTPHMITNIIELLKVLRTIGMSKILVPGMLPLGCQPGYLSLLHNVNPSELDADNCHIGLNNLARNHNHQLKHALSETRLLGPSTPSDHSLADKLPLGEIPSYAEIVYGDYYNSFMALLRENSNRNQRVLLFQEDGFHLTEEANKYIVDKLLSGNNFMEPEIHLPFVNRCIM